MAKAPVQAIVFVVVFFGATAFSSITLSGQALDACPSDIDLNTGVEVPGPLSACVTEATGGCPLGRPVASLQTNPEAKTATVTWEPTPQIVRIEIPGQPIFEAYDFAYLVNFGIDSPGLQAGPSQPDEGPAVTRFTHTYEQFLGPEIIVAIHNQQTGQGSCSGSYVFEIDFSGPSAPAEDEAQPDLPEQSSATDLATSLPPTSDTEENSTTETADGTYGRALIAGLGGGVLGGGGTLMVTALNGPLSGGPWSNREKREEMQESANTFWSGLGGGVAGGALYIVAAGTAATAGPLVASVGIGALIGVAIYKGVQKWS